MRQEDRYYSAIEFLEDNYSLGALKRSIESGITGKSKVDLQLRDRKKAERKSSIKNDPNRIKAYKATKSTSIVGKLRDFVNPKRRDDRAKIAHIRSKMASVESKRVNNLKTAHRKITKMAQSGNHTAHDRMRAELFIKGGGRFKL